MIWKPLKQETAKAWKLFTILLKTELIKAKRIWSLVIKNEERSSGERLPITYNGIKAIGDCVYDTKQVKQQ